MKRELIGEWLLVVSVFCFLLWANPFDLAKETQKLSTALLNQIIAPLYPNDTEMGSSGHPFNDTTQIAVVLFNDDALRELRNREDGVTFGSDGGTSRAYTWPIKYAVHRDVIAKIVEAKPAALFIDFGFFDNRGDAEGLQYFANFLKEHALPPSRFTNCALLYGERDLGEGHKDRGHDCSNQLGGTGEVPIFLATLDAGRPADLQVLQILAGSVTGLVTTRRHENRYELYDCRSGLPSPALAMYAVRNPLNQGLRPICGETGDTSRDAPDRPDSGLDAMSVLWPAWGSDGRSRGVFACERRLGTWNERLWYVTDNLWQALPDLDAVSLRQVCPPHHTISPAHLFDPVNEWMTYFMEDRYIIYGGDFVGANDRIRPPTHEAIPASYLQSMALDNLLRFGDHYLRIGEGILNTPAIVLIVLTSATIVFVNLLVDRWSARIDNLIQDKYIGKRGNFWWSLISRMGVITFIGLVYATAWVTCFIFWIFCFILLIIMEISDLQIQSAGLANFVGALSIMAGFFAERTIRLLIFHGFGLRANLATGAT